MEQIKKYLPYAHWVLTLTLLVLVFLPKKETKTVSDGQGFKTERASSKFSGTPSRIMTFPLPEKMDFAGEPIPLHISDVAERMDRELHTNAYWHTNTILLMKRAGRWFPQMKEVLKKYDIPEDFLYLTLIESSLINQVSPRGATGFWQIMAATGKEFGLEVNDEVDERYDPIKSTEVACKYLLRSYRKFGNWTHVAASYNMGMQGFYRSMVQQKSASYFDAYLNEETSRYLFRIVAVKEIFENPAKYGFHIPKDHLYAQPEQKIIEVNEGIKDLADWAKEQGINYKVLKINNPWLRKTSLTIKRGGSQSYQIKIPTDPFEEVSGDLDEMRKIDSLLNESDELILEEN